jgi:hypothetical protein
MPKRSRKPAPVVVKRLGLNHLDALIRPTVVRLCNGDASRVTVISRTEAIVR